MVRAISTKYQDFLSMIPFYLCFFFFLCVGGGGGIENELSGTSILHNNRIIEEITKQGDVQVSLLFDIKSKGHPSTKRTYFKERVGSGCARVNP